ncbi:DUF2812 domain-containing protein [Desulfosporosinus shakirovi]|uniref:DUF2812 domain-containing protein n=1 Tax=Desulfosporosinus shakirovi TaxID=2885154 RepID=UPI001E2A34DB|nr:DUF2812 domain-containing protein [Desulfosporosinus sp. SRJS8]MCB8818368.1 DUF2812 domain-containing protein [Desulfosporosinus sp. SRJS8]
MKYIIRKCFLSWNFDIEEKWLNEMSTKGLQLTSVGLCKYVFEDGVPGEYLYRLELLNNLPFTVESQRYISFIEDTGAEHVGTLFRWVYFRKKADLGEFDLFSDIDSRIKHLSRLLVPLFVVGVCVFMTGIVNMSVFLNGGFGSNLKLGIIDVVLGLLLFYGFANILFKKRRIKKERILHE